MDKEYIKHHYIPECYLINFSNNKKLIYVYNKKSTKKGFIKSISNIAYIKNFYDIDEELLNILKNDEYPEININEINRSFIEVFFFAKYIEKKFSEILKKFSKINPHKNLKNVIKYNDKIILSKLIAIQYLRLPIVRKKYFELYKKTELFKLEKIKALFKKSDFYKKEKDFIDSIDFEFDEKKSSNVHRLLFLDENIIGNIQNLIMKKNWVFYYSNEPIFYTSDNPIIFKPSILNKKQNFGDFGAKDIEIIFPITSKILLTMWDNDFFPEKSILNNSFQKATEKQIRQYNIYQYLFSNEETYSENNNFELIKLLKKVNNNDNSEIRFDINHL